MAMEIDTLVFDSVTFLTEIEIISLISSLISQYIFHILQIDATVIGILSDESLEKYIPKYDDRIAVKAYVNSTRSSAVGTF